MISKNPGRALLALSMLLFQARAADKIAKETLESQGKKRTYYLMESEYFAATAVHAGSWRTERELSAIDYAKRKAPLAIIVGDRDAFFPLPSVKTTEARCLNEGSPSR
jgi:hypothetical protein